MAFGACAQSRWLWGEEKSAGQHLGRRLADPGQWRPLSWGTSDGLIVFMDLTVFSVFYSSETKCEHSSYLQNSSSLLCMFILLKQCLIERSSGERSGDETGRLGFIGHSLSV